jgi:hypothetical protein
LIAYLFWHWPLDAGGKDYEAALLGFHVRLAEAGASFLAGNATYRVAGLPWLPGGAGYEDWYVVGDFGDLDALNETALAPGRREPHDAVAALAQGGAGGMYRLHAGELDLAEPAVTWVAKPRGTSYDTFYAELPPARALLRRQLVLGPAPEFCALGGIPGGLTVEREPVFVSAAR